MLQPRFAHILWDWNGTLYDDAAMAVDVTNRMLRARNKPVLDSRRYQEEFGFPVRDYYSRVGFDFASEPFEDLAAEFIGQYTQRLREPKLRAGAEEALRSLGESGYPQSILSATEQSLLEQMVALSGIRPLLASVAGLDNHYAASKVENGKRLIAELGCSPQNVLMVGDTEHDFEVARAMGTRCVLLPSGHQSRAKLERCGAPVVDSLADVVALLS